MSKKHNWYFVKEKNKTKQKQSELKNFIDFRREKQSKTWQNFHGQQSAI